MATFNREWLEKSHLPETFKGLSREYIIDKVFDEELQKRWYPQDGDIIVGCTGNIFVISGHHNCHESIGGKMFFFGGGLCVRGNGCFMDDTYCNTMNESGINYGPNGPKEDLYHSSWKDFRFVPYPHENR